MAKKKVQAEKKRHIKRDAAAISVVLLILYIGIHILSRTEGARSMVADKISNGTRLPVALEECGTTPLLGLRLNGLAFYGVEMPEVKVSFNWGAMFSKTKPLVRKLEIDGLVASFKRIPINGNWEPLVLHGLGSRLGAVLGLNPVNGGLSDKLPRFPGYVINEKTLLELRRAKVTWYDEKARELAYISDADLDVKVGSFIDRKAIHSIVRCGHIKLASGRVLRDFRLEAFRVQGSGLVTVLDMSDSSGQYDEFASNNLWQDLNLRLYSLSEL
jgi:hypothetical protein